MTTLQKLDEEACKALTQMSKGVILSLAVGAFLGKLIGLKTLSKIGLLASPFVGYNWAGQAYDIKVYQRDPVYDQRDLLRESELMIWAIKRNKNLVWKRNLTCRWERWWNNKKKLGF